MDEEKDKITGKTPPTAKAAATAMRVVLPIVKVPSNIVAETLEYATGLATGSVKTAQAIRAGVQNLKPEEADMIMRQLKKGSLGSAVMLFGYFAPYLFGGFYQPGEKRQPGDTPYGGAQIGGVEVPRLVLHSPLIEAAQMGATVKRVADSKLRLKDTQKQGIGAGVTAAALGLADDVPFIQNTFEASKLMDPRERGQWLGELAKARIVPQMLSQAAEHWDKDAQGNPIKRNPRTLLEHLETGIPGWRETVPVKTKR